MAQVIARRFHAHDATALVQAHLAALPPEGGTLYLAKDTYHFYEDAARTMWLDPSNNQSGEKRVVFPLVGRTSRSTAAARRSCSTGGRFRSRPRTARG